MQPGTTDIAPPHRPATVRELFRERRLRHTRQRDLIYSTLAALDSHPTAEQLHALVNAQNRNVSLATVYNTLDALARCGLLRRIPSHQGSGPCRFDADLSRHVHILRPEGSVQDLPSELGDPLLAAIDRDALVRIEQRMGMKVVGLTVQLVTATPG